MSRHDDGVTVTRTRASRVESLICLLLAVPALLFCAYIVAAVLSAGMRGGQ